MKKSVVSFLKAILPSVLIILLMIRWSMAGSEPEKVKTNVIAFCETMMVELASGKLTNAKPIVANEQFVLEGNCTSQDVDGMLQRVYCDIYPFKSDLLQHISSYRIEIKNEKK